MGMQEEGEVGCGKSTEREKKHIGREIPSETTARSLAA